MNQEQINGIIRILVPTICGLIATHISAFGNPDTVGLITTALIAIAAVGWSIFANTHNSQLKAVEQMKDMKIVVGPQAAMVAQDAARDTSRPNITTAPAADSFFSHQAAK